MVHCIILMLDLMAIKTSNYPTGIYLIFKVLAIATGSLLVALPLSLTIEVPFMKLEQLYLMPKKKPITKEARKWRSDVNSSLIENTEDSAGPMKPEDFFQKEK